MKTIPNTKFTLNIKPTPLDYSNIKLLQDCKNQSGTLQQGFTKEEMKKALRLDSIIDSQLNNDNIELEDSDYEYAKHKVDTMVWGIKDQNILNFINLFE